MLGLKRQNGGGRGDGREGAEGTRATHVGHELVECGAALALPRPGHGRVRQLLRDCAHPRQHQQLSLSIVAAQARGAAYRRCSLRPGLPPPAPAPARPMAVAASPRATAARSLARVSQAGTPDPAKGTRSAGKRFRRRDAGRTKPPPPLSTDESSQTHVTWYAVRPPCSPGGVGGGMRGGPSSGRCGAFCTHADVRLGGAGRGGVG